MRIGGFQKFSLSDFPGRTAAIIFTQGCNFRCPFCHNWSLIPSRSDSGRHLAAEKILSFLALRSGQLDGVVLSGGEPTLQPDLAEFIGLIKALHYEIKLDTNGSRPEVIRALLERNLVNFISMDVKAPPHKYDRLSGISSPLDKIKESIRIISGSGVEHEFRTTLVDHLLSPADIPLLRSLIPPGSKHTRQPYRS
ncbi:MAG: anaerobic ribonucleoside-triphosphate reductase activating protein, partial [Candidatus Krumholzibacteriota bacterium]|nr:anaerobic ribonucleoside-triphosphate reductase activating protein [Candidatus Krumholzibacteriota bacterium]